MSIAGIPEMKDSYRKLGQSQAVNHQTVYLF